MSTQVPPSRLDSTKDFSSLVPSAFSQANLAFAQANAAFAQANTGSSDSWARAQANAGFITANSASIFANGAFIQANAAYNAANNASDAWVRTQANNAYDTANSAGLYANGAFAAANSGSSAGFAFAQANAAFGTANSASLYANGAFTAANTADEKSTSAGLYSNGAFNSSNSASLYANGAFGAANSASLYANGAFAEANLKFNSTGGTISGDVSVTGNLTIQGNTFSINSSQLVANDTLFLMGIGNYTSDILDIGFAAHYNNGVNAHTGLIRDAGSKEWQLFEEYDPDISSNNNIDINHATFKLATLNANLKSTTVSIKNIDLLPYVNGVFGVANSGALYANGAFTAANTSDGKATSAGLYANGAFAAANSSSLYANASFIQANAVFIQSNNQVWPQANAAFSAANSASLYANAAFDRANGAFAAANSGSSAGFAFSQANAAFAQANAAFAAANTGGGGGSLTGYVDVFTGDGSNAAFTLSTIPSDEKITFVAVQGVIQPKSSYSLSGNVLTFDSTPPNTAYIEVTTLGATALVSITGSSITWYIANANTTMVTSSGYFVDTTNGPKTMTLPTSATLGDTIRINDLTGNFASNNLTVARNSHKIQGLTEDLVVDMNQSSFGLVYSNTTYGWKVLEL
jgi:hypothetical protein